MTPNPQRTIPQRTIPQQSSFILALIAIFILGGCGGERAAELSILPEKTAAALVEPPASIETADTLAPLQVSAHLTSKTPYPVPPGSDYSPAPDGFKYLVLQHVARHGSRGLSSPDDDDLSLQLWHKAREQGALTPLGEQLGPLVERVMVLHQRSGYGELSALGRREHRDMAARTIARQQSFFTSAAADGKRLSVSHSGKSRAVDSATAFVEGWLAVQPAYRELVDDAVADVDTVYFNSGKYGEAYEDYLDHDPRLKAALSGIENAPGTRELAKALLERLYSPEFVSRLDSGEWTFIAAADEDDTLSSAVDAALALYGLYVIASNLVDDEVLDFSPFITPEHAAWLAYVDDAESFYERGPGFVGEDVTYSAASVLVADMLDRISASARGERHYAADLRFTHAETLMPLASFVGIEGAARKVTMEQPFSYDSNPWRAEWVAPMAANVQWDAFKNPETGQVLVRMLHNEREVHFSSTCSAITAGSYFYALDELRRCLLSAAVTASE